jgi:ATP-dependent Clp protease adaptor protein ClpS
MEKLNQTDVVVATRIKTPKVPKYNVVMHNDDETTFEFVIATLIDIFDKDEVTATALAYEIHNIGSATVGSYSREVAESKVNETTERARAKGFPLVCTVEGSDND